MEKGVPGNRGAFFVVSGMQVTILSSRRALRPNFVIPAQAGTYLASCECG